MAVAVLPPVSRRRRVRDRAARGLLLGATLIALVPLFLIIYYVIKKGIGAWSADFFTTDPTGRTCFPGQTTCEIGGVRSAIVGTVLMVGLATRHRRAAGHRRGAVPRRVRQAHPL